LNKSPFISDLKCVIGAAKSSCCKNRTWILLAFLIGIGVTLLAFWKLDAEWLNYYPEHFKDARSLKKLCTKFGNFGEFQYYNLIVFALLLVLAKLRKNPALRRIAMASLLSGLMAGSIALIGKNTTGRPRPQAVYEGYEKSVAVFHGPISKSKLKTIIAKPVDPKDPPRTNWWQSFPSGHTAAAIGAALPVLIALPLGGIPIFLIAAAIALSRLLGGYHNPSDILAGLTLAVTVGIIFGLPLRKGANPKEESLDS
jgi:membrane-associated phospholipid phosphatase